MQAWRAAQVAEARQWAAVGSGQLQEEQRGATCMLQHHQVGPVARGPWHVAAHPGTGPGPEAAQEEGEGSGSDAGSGAGPLTRGALLQRHKKEVLAMKKALQRGGKKSKVGGQPQSPPCLPAATSLPGLRPPARLSAARGTNMAWPFLIAKECAVLCCAVLCCAVLCCQEEVARLTSELEARHAQELAEQQRRDTAAAAGPGGAALLEPSAVQQQAGGDQAAEALGGLGLTRGEQQGPGQGQPTKAMKRRQKAAAQEAEREARLAAEAAAAGPSAREAEEEALAALLAPLALRMKDIRVSRGSNRGGLTATACTVPWRTSWPPPASRTPGTSPRPSFLQLRKAAADHIRAHPAAYAAFMDCPDGTSAADAVEQYCQELEGTAAWGGQLELSVLAQVLKRTIVVHAVGLPPVTLGDDYGDNGPALKVCYLRHAFGLGEHYNSLESVAEADAALCLPDEL
ncbi:hypothetical protein QJQ45_015128 [Haematococcus lacustris]|nr:hypothetical protein QJQ45_015128 [Haematococcus lacustris]